MPLTGQATRSLRAMAHALKPVVQVGKQGATSPDDVGAALAELTSSELVQRIGRIVVLYKPHPNKHKIAIPKGYTAPPKRKAEPKQEPTDEASVESE